MFQNCLEITSGDYSMEMKIFFESKPCSSPVCVLLYRKKRPFVWKNVLLN